MLKVPKVYRVGLILSDEVSIADYELSVGNEKRIVCFYSNPAHRKKYCDLIVTDKEPNELASIPIQQKHCHGTTLVINKISNPFLEQQYESIFTNASLKYKLIKKLSEESITKLINAELTKHLVKDGKFSPWIFLFNKYTRSDLINRVFALGLLFVPFFLIILYLVVKCSFSKLGYSFSLLYWFVEYDPDYKKNTLGELKLLALLYTGFNLIFYYLYILSILGNINNDVFQFNSIKRFIHKCMQICTTLILFLSALIIFKAFFVLKYSFGIAKENSFIVIGSILDRYLAFLKDDYLIYYFSLLDGCLLLMTYNFFKTISHISTPLSSDRQNNLIREAKKSFFASLVVDIFICFVIATLLKDLIKDQQSMLVIQLILLQFAYLYVNISTIFYDFKYK